MNLRLVIAIAINTVQEHLALVNVDLPEESIPWK